MLLAIPLAQAGQVNLALDSGDLEFGPIRLAADAARDCRGRVYAAYGGVYVGVAIAWLWIVDQVRPTLWDLAGVGVALLGMSIIMFQPAR